MKTTLKQREGMRRWHVENRTEVRARQKRRYLEKRAEILAQKALLRTLDPEKERAVRRAAASRGRQSLSSDYVRKTLSNNSVLNSSDIPAELVELKRAQLLLHREIAKQQPQRKDT